METMVLNSTMFNYMYLNSTLFEVSCSAIYSPVCGKDGKTYGNACTAEIMNGVSVDYKGECKEWWERLQDDEHFIYYLIGAIVIFLILICLIICCCKRCCCKSRAKAKVELELKQNPSNQPFYYSAHV